MKSQAVYSIFGPLEKNNLRICLVLNRKKNVIVVDKIITFIERSKIFSTMQQFFFDGRTMPYMQLPPLICVHVYSTYLKYQFVAGKGIIKQLKHVRQSERSHIKKF